MPLSYEPHESRKSGIPDEAQQDNGHRREERLLERGVAIGQAEQEEPRDLCE